MFVFLIVKLFLRSRSLDIFTIQSFSRPKWDSKFKKLFWRGRDSSRERLELVLLSRKYPDLIDAGLTNMFFFREKEQIETYGPIYNRTSFIDFFKVKI